MEFEDRSTGMERIFGCTNVDYYSLVSCYASSVDKRGCNCCKARENVSWPTRRNLDDTEIEIAEIRSPERVVRKFMITHSSISRRILDRGDSIGIRLELSV
jgi:hypothetical protein